MAEKPEKIENIPCEKCGRTDLPLHYNRLCPECFEPEKPEVKQIECKGRNGYFKFGCVHIYKLEGGQIGDNYYPKVTHVDIESTRPGKAAPLVILGDNALLVELFEGILAKLYEGDIDMMKKKRVADAAPYLLSACEAVIDFKTLGKVASTGINRVKSYEIKKEIISTIGRAIKKAEGE